MMKILYFYLSGLLLLWSSCQRPTMLDFALRYAGENRVELEKVLDHYRNDSLKYRAAVFLIGNMPYHYFYTGAQLDSLRQGYRWMQRTGLSAKAVKHKLWKTFGEPDVRRWTKRNDARSVTADFLIRHIDYVFGVWRSGPGLRIILSKIFANLSCLTGLKGNPWNFGKRRMYGVTDGCATRSVP